MHEATQEAARYRKTLEERDKVLMDLVRKQQQPQPSAPNQPPPMTREAIEAKFYEDPVGFVMGLTQNTTAKVRQDTLNEFEQRLAGIVKQTEQQRFASDSQRYFDDTYKDLKDFEPFIDVEIRTLMEDGNFMQSIDGQFRTIPEKMRAVVDKAVSNVREKPIVKKFFEGTPEQKRERLPASPVVTPSGGSPVVSSKATEPETPEQYLEARRKTQDKIYAGRRT
jgi:hypothetical protein